MSTTVEFDLKELLEKLDSKIDKLGSDLNTKVDNLSSNLNTKIDKLSDKVDDVSDDCMTELLEQAIAKLKTRPISEQDSRSIFTKSMAFRQSSIE
jgi:murein lipoprotein